MLGGPIASLKYKLGLALQTTAGFVAMLAALVVSVGFFCTALFLWIARDFGAIAASLVLGGMFLLIALIALLVLLLLRRREPPKSPAWWTDPALLATVFDVGRGLGRGRTMPIVLIGAIALGLFLARSPRKPDQ